MLCYFVMFQHLTNVAEKYIWIANLFSNNVHLQQAIRLIQRQYTVRGKNITFPSQHKALNYELQSILK